MPTYDFECTSCGLVREASYRLAEFSEAKPLHCELCARTTKHDLKLTPPAIEDWGNGGAGRWFEHLGPKGMTFRDKASYKAHLRAEGLQEWAPKRGMPGQEV